MPAVPDSRALPPRSALRSPGPWDADQDRARSATRWPSTPRRHARRPRPDKMITDQIKIYRCLGDAAVSTMTSRAAALR
jgi:hypothetical protein